MDGFSISFLQFYFYEREAERERSSTCRFILHMPATARAEPGRSQEQGLQSRAALLREPQEPRPPAAARVCRSSWNVDTSLVEIQLPASGLGKPEDGPRPWGLHHVGDPEETPSSQPRTGPAVGVAAIWGMNPSHKISVSPSLCTYDFQVK